MKRQWDQVDGVSVLETRDLLGWFLFQDVIDEIQMTREEAQTRLDDFYEDLTDDVSRNILKARIDLEFMPHYSAFSLLYQQADQATRERHFAELKEQKFSLSQEEPVVFYGIGINTNKSIVENHLGLIYP